MTLKVAIIGCGKIADGHVESIREVPTLAQVVAVADLEPLMAEQIAARYGIPSHYADFAALLDKERPDVVHITTPPAPHLALARQALDAGCHLFVEKPLTPTFSETEELVRLVEKAQKKLTVGHTYHFDPPALAMRELIGAGVLGDPVHVESVFGYNLGGPFGTALLRDGSHWVHRLPGKLLQNNIDHVLNKVREFVPDDEPEIRAFGWTKREQRFGDLRDEMADELRVMLRGADVSAYATFSSHARPAAHYCRVFGTKNTLHVDYVMRTVTLDPAPTLPSAVGRLLPAFGQAWELAREGARNVVRFGRSEFHFFAGLRELLRRYYESILGDTAPPIAYADMLWIARVSERIYNEVARSKGRPLAAAASELGALS